MLLDSIHDNVVKRSSQLCGWILRTFQTRSSLLMLTLFKSIVLSRIDYGSQLWSPSKKGYILIPKVQIYNLLLSGEAGYAAMLYTACTRWTYSTFLSRSLLTSPPHFCPRFTVPLTQLFLHLCEIMSATPLSSTPSIENLASPSSDLPSHDNVNTPTSIPMSPAFDTPDLDGRQCGNNLALCNFAVVMELPDSLWMNWKSEFGVIFLRCSPR